MKILSLKFVQIKEKNLDNWNRIYFKILARFENEEKEEVLEIQPSLIKICSTLNKSKFDYSILALLIFASIVVWYSSSSDYI